MGTIDAVPPIPRPDKILEPIRASQLVTWEPQTEEVKLHNAAVKGAIRRPVYFDKRSDRNEPKIDAENQGVAWAMANFKVPSCFHGPRRSSKISKSSGYPELPFAT